jgi:hypothetical protein
MARTILETVTSLPSCRRAAIVPSVPRDRDRPEARRGGVLAFLAFALVLPGGFAAAQSENPACPPHLFTIERSKNANIVVYDANREPSGDFVASRPVDVYWLMNADKGQREELNAVEQQRAYGIDVASGKKPGTYTVTFRAGRRRRVLVELLDGCPVAIAPIGGHQGVLRRVFVKSKETIMMPKVEYVEFFGEEPATGAPLYEKFIPKN